MALVRRLCKIVGAGWALRLSGCLHMLGGASLKRRSGSQVASLSVGEMLLSAKCVRKLRKACFDNRKPTLAMAIAQQRIKRYRTNRNCSFEAKYYYS